MGSSTMTCTIVNITNVWFSCFSIDNCVNVASPSNIFTWCPFYYIMKAHEIIWIESNDYRILKTMHKTL